MPNNQPRPNSLAHPDAKPDHASWARLRFASAQGVGASLSGSGDADLSQDRHTFSSHGQALRQRGIKALDFFGSVGASDHITYKRCRYFAAAQKRTTNLYLEQLALPLHASNGTANRFRALATAWRSSTAEMPWPQQRAMHPTYQKIIALGKRALPLILAELEIENDDWYWALRTIADEDPVPRGERGQRDAMRRRWLEWGRRNGYLPRLR